MASAIPTPTRQIRALQDSETITVYQAYNTTIATSAVSSQLLTASPTFKTTRMTWIKPSWCWMMYRSGYSHKDANQAHILALKMKKKSFFKLLDTSVLTKHVGKGEKGVRVQWDPERGPRLEVLPWRSIQIGIPGEIFEAWAREWIESIEDVTDIARELKRLLDERAEITNEELIELGLLPDEQPLDIPEHIKVRLEMD